MQRIDLQTDDKQLTPANHYIAVCQLHFAFAQRLYFPAFQHQTRFKALFEKIVKRRLFVIGNAGVGSRFFSHGTQMGMTDGNDSSALGLVYNPAQTPIL